MLPAAPTDVLAVWTGHGFAQDAIRIGDVIEGKPAVANHVIGLTHQDKLGRWMGLEGRPGGFGLVDATPYLSDPRTKTNHAQPRTPQQVTGILAVVAKLTGTPYDWVGIDEDLDAALHLEAEKAIIDRLWAWPDPHSGLLPGHVVCSSSWAFAYAANDTLHPDLGEERICTPGDWWDWSDGQLWA